MKHRLQLNGVDVVALLLLDTLKAASLRAIFPFLESSLMPGEAAKQLPSDNNLADSNGSKGMLNITYTVPAEHIGILGSPARIAAWFMRNRTVNHSWSYKEIVK